MSGDHNMYASGSGDGQRSGWRKRQSGTSMNIYTSEAEYLKTQVQRLSALVRAQQITIDKLEAQLEQEPVAWEQFYPEMGSPKLAYLSPTESPDNACYIPPQRKPLTDEEIDELSRSMVKGDKSVNWLCRAIEAAHGIQEDK